MSKIFAFALAVFGLAGFPAFAGTLDAATILRDFNAVIYNNASTGHDIEGAAVVGGSYGGPSSTVYNHPSGVALPSGFSALTVYGSTSGGAINLDNGGSAYVGGNQGAKINFNGGGSYVSAPGVAISDFKSLMNGLSATLSNLAPTLTLSLSDWNNVAIKAVAGQDGIAVLDITADQLSKIGTLTVDLNGASGLIINVSGKSVTDKANDNSGTTGADKIIWNFYQADTVALKTLIGGTVLAPNAKVTNDNQIDGTLVASSWTGNGELHSYGYDGALPGVVPEPAALCLLGGGLLSLGAIRRRNRRA